MALSRASLRTQAPRAMISHAQAPRASSCEDHSMAHVSLIGNLRQYTGGVTELDVEAANVRQLFARLGEKYPGAAAAPGDGLRRRHRRADLPGRAVPADRPRQRRAHPAADRGGMRRGRCRGPLAAPQMRQRAAQPCLAVAGRCGCPQTVLRASPSSNDDPGQSDGDDRRPQTLDGTSLSVAQPAADAGRDLLGGQHGRRPARRRPDLAVPC